MDAPESALFKRTVSGAGGSAPAGALGTEPDNLDADFGVAPAQSRCTAHTMGFGHLSGFAEEHHAGGAGGGLLLCFEEGEPLGPASRAPNKMAEPLV